MTPTIDYGIDLGTTNSSIGHCRDGEVRIFQNADLMNCTPSVVYVGRTGRMLVGRKAYDTWVADPQNTQAEFKRWMGFSDQLTFPASGKKLSAEELSAEVLKALRADAMRAANEMIDAAVITVPAAFGSLQCDATARAAKMAGFEQSPLLQEPIAAAIAYGASADARGTSDQRWMVFDLGGGTLDIAVVSTRNGRLAVLEHQGDNRLGGKDIDRLLAEEFLLAPLAREFSLPDRKTEGQAFDRLFRNLVRQAEVAKIALSNSPQAVAELFDLGEDRDGKPIEAVITLKRSDVELKIQPLIERCLDLARRAMEGARLANSDLDRILLVGGPTQMPILRHGLEYAIGAKLDCSLDPMTVVARGAALYASTLKRTTASASLPQAKPAEPTGNMSASDEASAGNKLGDKVIEKEDPKTKASARQAVGIQLHYERASGTMQSPVAGILEPSRLAATVEQVRIDSDGGFWTSGWFNVIKGRFQLDVMLTDRKPVTRFRMQARDGRGNPVKVEPAEFSVTYMLPMAAPPLPHTIAIELSTNQGRTSFDPVFPRHSPLPAEARKTYRADRTIRPSEMDATLPIKFWEVDVSDDPQERWWAGSVHLRAERLKRPILEGSELELTVKIDPSRKMTVEVFVPLLNESFVDGVFIPDPPTARTQLQQQLDLCFDRLEHIRRAIYELDRDELRDRVDSLQERLEAIWEQVNGGKRGSRRAADNSAPAESGDPDAVLSANESLRSIRIQLAHFEEQLETSGGPSALSMKVQAEGRYAEGIVLTHGTDTEKEELSRLLERLKKYVGDDDARGLKWVYERLRDLRAGVLNRQPWFWNNLLSSLQQPGKRFVNQEQAQSWMSKAEQAQKEQNFPELRKAVSRVYELQTPDQVEQAREQAAESGLRGE